MIRYGWWLAAGAGVGVWACFFLIVWGLAR
jgi:hypothetical protein